MAVDKYLETSFKSSNSQTFRLEERYDDDDDTTPFEGGRENIFVRLTDFHSSFHDLLGIFVPALCI